MKKKTEADAQNAEIRQRKALCGTNQRTTVCPQQGGPQSRCVQAVSEIDGEGKVRTVPAEEKKNENSFLKFEKNSSILENIIKISGATSRNRHISGSYE